MWKQLLPGLRMTLFLTLFTGLIYPGVVTGLCQLMFNGKANGSLITRHGRIVGSELIGQNFSKPEYFQPRPSAAGSDGYDAANSGGSNLGPTSKKLVDRVSASVTKIRSDNPGFAGAIPADLATASASGIDPHLSPASVDLQVDRVAKTRNASPELIRQIAERLTEGRTFGLFGEPRVNVLLLNLALDESFPIGH